MTILVTNVFSHFTNMFCCSQIIKQILTNSHRNTVEPTQIVVLTNVLQQLNAVQNSIYSTFHQSIQGVTLGYRTCSFLNNPSKRKIELKIIISYKSNDK